MNLGCKLRLLLKEVSVPATTPPALPPNIDNTLHVISCTMTHHTVLNVLHARFQSVMEVHVVCLGVPRITAHEYGGVNPNIVENSHVFMPFAYRTGIALLNRNMEASSQM